MLNLSKIILITALIVISSLARAEDKPLEWGERLHFFRWLENYDNFVPDEEEGFASIKRITLTENNKPYLTIGGDYRYRFEHYSNQFFGILSTDSSNSRLQRVLLHGDLQLESSRVFVQLSQYSEEGLINGPRPLDESSADIHQAFFEQQTTWGNIRVGRQEFVLGGGKKTGVREGPNQRRAFDGIKLSLNGQAKYSTNLFYLQEVLPNKSSFEDSSSSGPKFYGIYANKLIDWSNHVSLDLFYYGYEHEQREYQQGIGREKRHSIGTRLYRNQGNIHFDYELTYQFGDFERSDIAAWGLATETLFTVDTSRWIKNWGVRLNYASGDNNSQDAKLGTYNALFPNAAYVSESALFSPGNIKDIQPFVLFSPANNITIFTGLDFLWRASKGDALYVNPGFPLLVSNSSNESYYGSQFNVIATWKLTDFFTLQSFYTKTNTGKFIEDNGGLDSEFFMLSAALRF